MIARCSLLVCALAICCTTLPTVTAADDPEVFIFGLLLDKQTELVWAIKRSRLMAIPPWHEGIEEAPLSPHKAVTVASESVQSRLGVHGGTIIRIIMIHLGEERDNRWGYEVFFSSDPPLESEDPLLRVLVAMDGKVIVSEKRPRTDHVKPSN
jgi:hypothetical protein